MASYNTEEGAQMWYIQVQTDKGTLSWRRFKELLNLHYVPSLRAAPLAKLAECRRMGMVAEYQDRFQALLPCAGPLTEAQRVQLFTGGLQPPLSINVQIRNPQSLAAAMSLACQFELREQYTTPAAGVPPRPLLPALAARLALAAAMSLARQFELREQYTTPAARAPPSPLLPAPATRLALPVLPSAKAATPATITVEGRRIKCLTQAEQEECRHLGLYYNCDDKFTRATTVCASGCSSSRVLRRRTTGRPRRPLRTWGLRTRQCSPSRP
jgi:hypothetical protein